MSEVARRKPESVKERDERIVAEAGPWEASVLVVDYASGCQGVVFSRTLSEMDAETAKRKAVSAARILNRIARERRGKGRA